MTCNLPRDFQVFWPKILWLQASSSCFPWGHCRQWRMPPKALAMWWKEKARSIPSVAPSVTWKAKKELWCHSFGSSHPLKKPWLIWWPPLPRVKMAHGPFQATRIPPRLMQESSYCITSPRMRTWGCLPPGRGRRPADFFCRHVDQVSNCHLPPEPAFEARASGGKNVNVFLWIWKFEIHFILMLHGFACMSIQCYLWHAW